MEHIYIVQAYVHDYDAPAPDVWVFLDPPAARTKFEALKMIRENDHKNIVLSVISPGGEINEGEVIDSFQRETLDWSWAYVQEKFREKARRLARRKVPVKFEYINVRKFFAA